MELQELEQKIKDANWAYWIDCNPIISDFEYDALIEELKKQDPENDLINAFTFVGTEQKVVHSKPMLSLDKAYSLEEVMKWAKKYARSKNEKFYIMPKYDGLSGKFENGKLSSRGDGKVGQDYTDRLPLIKFQTNRKNVDVLLGEMLITNDDFEKIAKTLKTKSGIPFKNQRNAAAGIIGCDDVEFYSKQGKLITFVDYESLKFEVTFENFKEKWTEVMTNIQKQPYPMDGIVIKLADPEYYESLGNTEHAPRGGIAFKYTNQSKWTKLIGCEWTMGKDQIACVGQVEPIDITGTTIKNVKIQLTKPVASEVTTYAMDGSLQIGDYVLIERAGDIIPHIKESKPGENRTPIKLDKCPFCGGKLEINETSISCLNPDCTERKIQGVLFAMGTLGFKGMGEAYAKNLHLLLGVDNVDKLMKVTKADLNKHKEFGAKMADNFLAEQKKVKEEAGIEKVLVAMNIPSLGKSVSKILLENFDLTPLIGGDVTYKDLIKIQGIGPVAAEEVSKGLKERSEEIKSTISHFSIKKQEKSEEKTGEKICFTGKMEHTRSEMEALATEHGYVPVDHIDKETNILVCADPSSTSGKMQKARKLGCKIISEAEFYKILG